MEEKVYIGIDPGVHTGIAVWNSTQKRFMFMDTAKIGRAIGICLAYFDKYMDLELVVEDARQRKWIPREQSLSQFKGRAMGAGSINRDCQIWEEFAQDYGLDLTLVPPRKGATKWDADYFEKVTGWKGRTSNHARDAALLVFGK